MTPKAGIALDHLPFAAARYDEADRLVEVNAAWRSLTRLPDSLNAPGTPRRMVLRALAERGLLGPGDPARAAAAALAPADPARPRRRHHPDGSCIDVHLRGLPDGDTLVICHDITAATNARREADQVAARLQAALEAVPLGVALLDTADRLWLHNARFATLLGFLPPGPAPRIALDDLLAAIATRATRLDEPDCWARDDGQVVRLRAIGLPDGGKLLAADLPPAPAAPPAGAALLLARIRQALRGPVADIAWFAHALDAATPAGQARGHARAITVAIGGIEDILEAMGDVARIEAGGFDLREEVLDLGALLRQTVADAGPACAATGLTLDGRIPRALPLLRADPRVLTHVVTHLLVNAVRFTPPGGAVSLRAQILPAGGDPSGGLAITVADEGPGIPPDLLARLFEPFAQFDAAEATADHSGAEDRFPGAGLGLYVCRALILAHGGALTLHSLPGDGTTARLVLPAARLLPPAAIPTVPETPP